jgi:hypothetical protein
MAGIRALRKTQFAIEAALGVQVPATKVWRGLSLLTDARVKTQLVEDAGRVLSQGRTVESYDYATLAMPTQPVTFEQLPVILSAGIDDVVTGVDDGVATGHVYAYGIPVTTLQAPKSYCFEVGDDSRVILMEYGTVQNFTLEGASKGPINLTASWFGRQATVGAFTAAIALPTPVEEAVFANASIAIDDTTDVIGATPILLSWLGFKLAYDTGQYALFSGDGGPLTFAGVNQMPPVITGEFTFLHNAVGIAEYAHAIAEDLRIIRIKIVGAAFAIAGVYTRKTIQIDLAIKYTALPVLSEADGNDTIVLPWHVVDSVADVASLGPLGGGSITVVIAAATIP